MWQIYVDARFGSSPDRVSVYVWSLRVGEGDIAEISSAKDWVEFVANNGHAVDGMVYPDWSAASKRMAGVHLTIRAIAAIQGFCFETSAGLIAPEFWDVEQTFWLRWAFERVTIR